MVSKYEGEIGWDLPFVALLQSLLGVMPTLSSPSTASMSSSSLSSVLVSLAPLIFFPTPIPKLGILGPPAGLLPPVMNLMLPT